ncbi:LAMI_0G06810g1_1 [Lachancea mirantina]|uniref:LAMI_0G06810g1_1 n=1 Tax=Lachancea mirantina TaxID=1230905 RepID=A0A1G4K9F4_9SACH|nr:LAMI_0G06810g1_1 [Lachancea mirantina]
MDGFDEPLGATSNSTSTNSLFSLNKRDSYSSILDQYGEEAENEETRTECVMPDPTVLTLNCANRGRRTSVFADAPILDKTVIVLVGLPASGKSTISNHLQHYLKQTPATAHLRCKIFNAGQVRRKLSCRGRPMMLANNSSEDLFNPKNTMKKEKYAKITLEQLFGELDRDLCDVAIFDATNSTEARRAFLFHEIRSYNARLTGEFRITPMVLQVGCVNENFVKFNIHNKTFNQDYFDKPYDFAVRDFARRLTHYSSQFVAFDKLEFDRHVAEGKLVNEDTGLFWFNIVNAGLLTNVERSHFPPKCASIVKNTVSTIEAFVTGYAKIYGHQYIEQVKSFANGLSTLKASQDVSQTKRVPYSLILSEILDHDYFEQLMKTAC